MIHDIPYLIDAFCSKIARRCSKKSCFTRNQVVYRYVQRRFKRMALKYSSFAEASVTANTNNTIWVFWAQGRDHMPALVKQCVEQIDRMKGEFRLVVLDTDSYKQYVTLPNVVLRKLAEGKMTLTHFSDILRFALLRKYGGWWMDATIFPVHQIDKQSSLYSIKTAYQPQYISECKWSSFLWYMPAGHPMACFLSEAWKKYWEKNDELVEYFLIDQLVKLFYNTSTSFCHEIDALPMENEYLYFMQSEESNLPFDEDKWKEICNSTKFFKCNWRSEIKEKTFRWQVLR